MPEPPDISFLLGRTPEEIVEWFESKGYAISWNWRDVMREQHNKAFTVAKVLNADVLQSIREEVERAISEGTTLREFQKNLEPTLRKQGWWGEQEVLDKETGEVKNVQLGSAWRLKNIYRTNTTTAYAAGRYQHQIQATDSHPYWMYETVGDTNVREEHEAIHGTILRADDPWWDANYPPNDWGCRCSVRTLSQRRLESLGLSVSEGSQIGSITGEGWDYNPGKETYSPDMTQYPSDLQTQIEAALDKYEPLDP